MHSTIAEQIRNWNVIVYIVRSCLLARIDAESFGNFMVSSSVIMETEQDLRRMSWPFLWQEIGVFSLMNTNTKMLGLAFCNRVRTKRANYWKKRTLSLFFVRDIETRKFSEFLPFCLSLIFNKITNTNLSIIKISTTMCLFFSCRQVVIYLFLK